VARSRMQRDNFDGMTAAFPSGLSISVPIGRP